MNSQIRIKRYLKRILYRFNIHRFLPSNTLETLSYLSKASQWINSNKNVPFSSYPYSGFDYNNRYELFDFVIKSENLDAEIDYLEFGVAQGSSFKWWTDKIKNKNALFYGFDTFTGLPEDWGPFKKGAMSNDNTPPEIKGNRHSFYQGLFQTTLPLFLKEYSSNRKMVIHIDADLFSSTLFVLTTLNPYLKKGDILFFDEFNVPMHEFKAFKLWVESYYINYTVLGEVNNYYQTAIRIE